MGKNVNYKAKIIGNSFDLEYEGIDDDISGEDVEVIYEYNDGYCICKTKNDREYDIPKNLLKTY